VCLSAAQGVNTPTVTLPISPLTPKDRVVSCAKMEIKIKKYKITMA
jgi:hypothetical protein